MAAFVELSGRIRVFCDVVGAWYDLQCRLSVEERDHDRHVAAIRDEATGRLAYFSERAALAAQQDRDAVAACIRRSGQSICDQLPPSEAWIVRKLVQWANQGDEGAAAFVDAWPTVERELQRLDDWCSEPQGLGSELVTIDQIGELLKGIVSVGRLRNSQPPVAVPRKGRKAALYRYSIIRPWILQKWPEAASRLPESLANVADRKV